MKKKQIQIDPREDGNTKHPHRGKQESGAAHWTITVRYRSNSSNVLTKDILLMWFEEHTETAVFQLEKGEEEGYLHWQIQMKLKKKQRLTWLSNHFCRFAHCEVTRNIDAANGYCCKEETRLEGPYLYPIPVKPKTDYFEKEELKYTWWQKEIISLLDKEPGREIYWYWEPKGGIGKTTFMRHLCLKYNVFPLENAKKSDIAFAMKKMDDSQNTVIFDLPRSTEGQINYTAIESILNGMIFSSKYESGFIIRDRCRVIVLANWEPQRESMSQDRWVVKEITMTEHP